MAEDKILRLIMGIILVLISIPGLSMSFGMGGMMGMMYSGYNLIGAIISLGILVLGIYLIIKGVEK